MQGDKPKAIYLQDYTPPDYLVDDVALEFELGEEFTRVRSRLAMRRNHAENRPLVLDGQELVLRSVSLDGRELSANEYACDKQGLTIAGVPGSFVLEIETEIRPQENTSLEGLYKSSGNFCTQCEAEGFRKITYFPDRPDVMARFTTTVIADQAGYPVLLSNGNPIARGELEHGRHWVKWQDPFPKPAYLFALVAGDLRHIEDTYVTRSGKPVSLLVYVEPDNIDKCDHAMAALKKAMRWDEETFGLEYDLDIYMIVAVNDFNMGAMENKGLNVFNSKYVLARPETATDEDYDGIEGVIGHEYFHNWTGNRVTCRDWFQLSLKEGLTVFRDQEFTADMTSRAVKRIHDVRALRAGQFPEDDSPMAHPVRPDSYVEINNFYTATVYNKGAEVVRMYQTLLGVDGFRMGMDLYFERHDGQAVTVDDFYAAMADANRMDLAPFKHWYSQAGTPVVTVTPAYDETEQVFSLTVGQACPPTPGQERRQPFLIPLAVGLLDREGRDMPLQQTGEQHPAAGATRVLRLDREQQEFRFINVKERPVPSLLRGFSAPVKLRYPYTERELCLLMAHDSDLFNRWEAGQQLLNRVALKLIEDHRAGTALRLEPVVVEAFGKLLEAEVDDKAWLTEVLVLPSEGYLAEQLEAVDTDAIHEVRQFMRVTLARELRDLFLRHYHANHERGAYHADAASVARRRLKNVCLGYLMELDDADTRVLCVNQFRAAGNMTDTIGALRALADCDCGERVIALDEFYAKWKHDPLVLDKWFALQAGSKLPDTLDTVKRLMGHEAFEIKNPNKVRALIGVFSHANPARFHNVSGAGYRFLADVVLKLDPMNPMVAARLLRALSRWEKYEPMRQKHMQQALERILTQPGLSRDCYEIASKSLEVAGSGAA